MDKLIGTVLNDRYFITEIIGVGGMAVVYKAFDKVVNRVVAVKILKEEFMSDAQFRRRFSNESKAITMLSQGNIVDVYDVCLEGDMMFIVMEYIDGVTLKEYLDKVKVLEWREAAFYIKQILKAMSHAHERGIVHRDLKPHNIMLLRDGTIKVTDFGIAKLSKFDTQTITDKAIGSVHYISPEQASGDRTDEKTDIYSVGVMFYEMITGTLPFIADSAVSVALMQVQAQPKLPREINEEIPAGVEEITIKAMMKDPEIRYASASAMFNDIVSIEANPNLSFGYLNINDDEILPPIVEDDSPTKFIDINNINIDDIELDKDDDESDYVRTDDEDEEESEEVVSKFKEIWLPIIAGIASALLVIGLVVGGIIFSHEIGSAFTSTNKEVQKVVVENYVGKNYDTVVQENATGLVFERENVLSEEKEGTILSQDPASGTEVEKGSVVTFKVSTGVETVQIPDVANKYYQIAIDELFALGIDYKTRYISDDSVKENYVVRTDPKAFTEITSDTQIVIYISSGPEIVTINVPDVVSRDEADAVKKLADKGLKAEKLYEYDESVPIDCVISQYPEAGAKVDEGSSVEIVISKGPKPEDKPEDSENKTPDNGSEGENNNTNTENPDNGSEGENNNTNTENPDNGSSGENNNTNTENPDNGSSGENNNTNTENPDNGSSGENNNTNTENPDNSTSGGNTDVPTGGDGADNGTGGENSGDSTTGTDTQPSGGVNDSNQG